MTPARAGRGDPGFYAERGERRDGPLDRLVAQAGFRLRMAFARELAAPEALAQSVAAHAARLRAAPLAGQVPELRYRLRRDGLSGERLAECFGMHAAALGAASPPASAPLLAAAAALVAGGVVEVADAAERRRALALAATAFALCGVPVHVYAAGEAQARRAAGELAAPLAAMGLGAALATAGMSAAERRVAYGAPVACGAQRVFAFDYLRDRLQLGRRLRPLQSRIDRLAGDTTSGFMPLLSGLHCALVADADEVLLDEARQPMIISADIESSAERLPYEQALELARALEPQADFLADAQAARLTESGAQRLARFGEVLGGFWAARKAREDLAGAALVALHALERGRDYEVEHGALRLLAPADEQEQRPSEALQRLLEIKEGLPFAGRREVLARLSVPRFFRRYLRLAGVCADARGLETELWSLYGLRTARAGQPPAPPAAAARVFATGQQRREALLAAARERAARGEAVVLAVRSAAEAGALAGMLQQAAIAFQALQPGPDGPAGGDLGALAQPGAVALSLFPAQRGAQRPAQGAPLHLAVCDLHSCARHVAQIAQAYGAASCAQYLDLEDEAVRGASGHAGSDAPGAGGELEPAQAARIAARTQRASERASARARAEAMAREQSLEDLLAFAGRPE